MLPLGSTSLTLISLTHGRARSRFQIRLFSTRSCSRHTHTHTHNQHSSIVEAHAIFFVVYTPMKALKHRLHFYSFHSVFRIAEAKPITCCSVLCVSQKLSGAGERAYTIARVGATVYTHTNRFETNDFRVCRSLCWTGCAFGIPTIRL